MEGKAILQLIVRDQFLEVCREGKGGLHALEYILYAAARDPV